MPLTIKTRKGETVFDTDEHPRFGVTEEALAKVRPAFKKDGTVTAGNASGINDGGAALVVMSAEKAASLGLKPLCRIRSYAYAGVDPSIMGTGPIEATKKCLAKGGLSVADLDLIEANEAFASQAQAVINTLGLNTDIVNVNGGAIALGPSHRLLRSPDPDHPDLRDGQTGLQIGPGHAVHRRRHGRGHGGGKIRRN